MSDDPPIDSSVVVSAFLLRFVEDQAAGRVQPLGVYLARYPGHEDAIRREYERLGSQGSTASAESTINTETKRILESLGHPRQVGPYKIQEVIGQGGMGVVYVAEEIGPLRRRVALKLVKVGMDTREVLARFESERQALALMSHPNIARVLGAGATETGRPYFVMEYVPGVPITRFCDQHRLNTKERLLLFLQVCDAVQHAHQKGIIHRDLKPANVLVTFDDGKPVAKVIDFGVAKSTNHRLTEDTLFTEQGQIIGTPEYMSPEQAEMSALDIDTRTDIYSLGVLLYELLVGRLPFDFGDLRRSVYADIQRRILGEEPVPPSTRLTRLGKDSEELARLRKADVRTLTRLLRGDLDWITLKTLEKDRTRRYASASELSADVQSFLRDEPVVAGPPGVRYRLGKWARRHRAGVVVGVAALALLAVALAAGWQISARAEQAQRAEQCRGLLADAEEHLKAEHALKAQVKELEDRWTKARQELEPSAPVWKRNDEIGAWHECESARSQLGMSLDRAVHSYYQALNLASPGSDDARKIRSALERLYFERYREALGEGAAAGQYETLLKSVGLGTYTKAIEQGVVRIQSDPPGATVYCFRYENREERLTPIPFDVKAGLADPVKGLINEPGLVVDAVPQKPPSPFVPGDRLVAIGGAPLSTLTGLAGALATVTSGQALDVKVVRDGAALIVSWAPFLEETDVGRLLGAQALRFHCYPLVFLDGARVGTTPVSGALEIPLPKGSYLFVLRREGFDDARLPLAILGDDAGEKGRSARARLLRPDEIPPGFVHVPAGPAWVGGDPEVFQPLERGLRDVDAFLVGRTEVTVREYLEFLNDTEVSPRIVPESGRLRPEKGDVEGPPVIPRQASGPLFEIDLSSNRWKSKLRDDEPVLSVSEKAAEEYAHWLTRKHGGKWRFRLPTDVEWEKAARGVDRRYFVWGNYPIWSYCRSLFGSKERSAGPVGHYPADESVFGVRDLAGSVCEPTSNDTVSNYVSLRGGSWYTPDAYAYRIANRNGRFRGRNEPGVDMGFRMAADVAGR